MKKLCFGSYATVLGLCMNTDVYTLMALCEGMFTSVAPEVNFSGTITDSNRTDMFRGRNPLPKEVTLGITNHSYRDIAESFKHHVIPLLDDNKQKQIIAVMKDIIADDGDITDATEIEYVNHAQKGSIARQTVFVLHEFLAGLLIYVCRSNNKNLITRVSEITEEYVNDFADKTDDIHLVDSYVVLPPELADMTHAHELVLYTEANGKCTSCGRPVALEKDIGDVDYCQIFHTKDDTGNDVDLVLCVDCARDYANAPREYIKKLLHKKAYHKIQIEALNSIGFPRQKSAIEEAIHKLAGLNLPFDRDLKYEPTRIENKIVDNSGLRDAIIWNANYWFRAINTEIENAAEAKILRPERFSKAFSTMYEQVKQTTDDQTIIYETIVGKLSSLIGEEYRSQCECIVSYFVQSCEVFDEVTKQDNSVPAEHNSGLPESPLATPER